MFKLLKNGSCFIPESAGKNDILVVHNIIGRIMEHIPEEGLWDLEVLDCSGKIVCPGFIDQHVHITGGGGEEGPGSRIPELMLGEIISAGVTTLVGVLGVDCITRNMANLLAKARALEEEGITTFIYTGSYSIPTATLTGRVSSDIALIDKIVGTGEIAISDYRSSQPSLQMLKEIASEARIGGLVGGKAGVMHIHVGDGKEGLLPLFRLQEESDLPVAMFVPTHLNRNKSLLHQAMEYAFKGGSIDLTAGETSGKGYSVPDALELLSNSGVNMSRVTVSSDGNGSIPPEDGAGFGVGRVKQLYDDIRDSILVKGLDTGQVLSLVTANVAKVLGIFPKKGSLTENCDADILVLNENDMSICHLLVKGEIFIKDGKTVKKGRYERTND